jgi:hypothetical protein
MGERESVAAVWDGPRLVPNRNSHQSLEIPLPAVLYFRVDFLIMLATSLPSSRT